MILCTNIYSWKSLSWPSSSMATSFPGFLIFLPPHSRGQEDERPWEQVCFSESIFHQCWKVRVFLQCELGIARGLAPSTSARSSENLSLLKYSMDGEMCVVKLR